MSRMKSPSSPSTCCEMKLSKHGGIDELLVMPGFNFKATYASEDGFERFAQGQLITLFSATNYCGTANNAGAILVVGRGLVIIPKLIHPIPPPLQSPETSPERVIDDTWMQELNIQRPPTPTRGRPQPDHDRNSLAYI